MMRLLRPAALLAGAAILAGCGGDVLRYEVPTQPAAERVAVSTSTLEVLDVSLPLYAAQEVIYVETADGAIVADPDLLWADNPQRTFTEGLATALTGLTSATVAAEPWPFYERPSAQLAVRLSRALATAEGLYVIEGQYFVAADTAGRDRAGSFRLTSPITEPSRAAIAAAQARVIDALARQIASDGL